MRAGVIFPQELDAPFPKREENWSILNKINRFHKIGPGKS